MYKAIFIDIDGTLRNSKLEVSKENINAIENANKKGVKTFLISGRSRMSAIEFSKYTSKYMINTNGAEIYDCDENKYLFQCGIEPEICDKIYKEAISKNMLIKLDFGFSRAVSDKDYMESYEIELTESIDEFLRKNTVLQIEICCEDIEKIEEMKKIIENVNGIKVTNKFIWDVKGKRLHAIHCTNPSVSKGNAMNGLCKFLKMDLSEVVAIGDKGNDISMIQIAGLGVAMGNAKDELKEVADFVTDTNDENGVARVVEKVLNENEIG